MAESPALAHPNFQEPFILDTDASDIAIGAVLSQKINGQEYVTAYASRTLTNLNADIGYKEGTIGSSIFC